MDLNDFQSAANETAVYPEDMEIIYPAMLIGAEAGEMQNKIQKLIRRGILTGSTEDILEDDEIDAIVDEVGDVLWGCAALLFDLNTSMSYCAKRNLNKLKSRMERGVINGSGDDR